MLYASSVARFLSRLAVQKKVNMEKPAEARAIAMAAIDNSFTYEPFIRGAENDFGHQRAAAEAQGALLTIRTCSAHPVAKGFEGRRVPGFLDGDAFARGARELHLIAPLLIEAAGNHHHIRPNITTISTAFTSIQRLRQNEFTEFYCSRDIAAVHTNFERMPFVNL